MCHILSQYPIIKFHYSYLKLKARQSEKFIHNHNVLVHHSYYLRKISKMENMEHLKRHNVFGKL